MKRLNRILTALFIIIAIFVSVETRASEPPSEPILRIEAGMHTAPIWSIGIDAENRYLATGSNDKTVRVWDLSTGRLIRLLRIPNEDGNEGQVYALVNAEKEVIVFASSTGIQYSLEDSAWGNGAFTKALIEGLSGKADYTGKGKITINMLDLYISERVKELTKGKQTPTTTKPNTVPDFPLAVIKK